jgi:hypothetical protein
MKAVIAPHLIADIAIALADDHALTIGLDERHPVADLKVIHSITACVAG